MYHVFFIYIYFLCPIITSLSLPLPSPSPPPPPPPDSAFAFECRVEEGGEEGREREGRKGDYKRW